jgi:hypothetical protein
MKTTKKKLKELIKEELSIIIEDEDKNKVKDYTDYEEEDLSTDEQMIALLQEILAQLKVLNLATTQAQDFGASAAEKAKASIAVAEIKDK